jgi:DNA repair photolyase
MERYSIYEYALSPTSQFYFCGVPFRLDTISICPLRCRYCYAISRGGNRSSRACLTDHEQLIKKLDCVFGGSVDETDINGEMLLHLIPLHFGGVSDPFANRLVAKRSIELLSALRTYDYPVIISTKNTRELIREEIMGLLKDMKHLVVQVSISIPNRRISSIVEPKAPRVSERIECIKLLNDEGIHSIARLQPLFVPWIKKVKDDLIPQIGATGCKHTIVEFLKIPVESRSSQASALFASTGWDGYSFYKDKGARLIGREWVLPSQYKWELLQPIIETIHKNDMSYGSGDYGLNHLGDTVCCCGIDDIPGFSNWFKGNFSNVIRNSLGEYISFSEVMKHWLPNKSMKRYMNSKCRPSGDNSILSYLRQKWNKPGSINAPDCFLGVFWSHEYDRNGDCIYVKNRV